MYTIPICNERLTMYGEEPPCTTPPTINGLTPVTLQVGEEFDPMDGVTAEDCKGNDVPVTWEQGE